MALKGRQEAAKSIGKCNLKYRPWTFGKEIDGGGGPEESSSGVPLPLDIPRARSWEVHVVLVTHTHTVVSQCLWGIGSRSPFGYQFPGCLNPLDKWSGTISRASFMAQMVKNLPQCRRSRFSLWVREFPWRRAWQSTPVFLPGQSKGQRSLVGYSLWDRKELDMTERLNFHFYFQYNKYRWSSVPLDFASVEVGTKWCGTGFLCYPKAEWDGPWAVCPSTYILRF